VPFYYNVDCGTALLFLVCHAGKERLVPIFKEYLNDHLFHVCLPDSLRSSDHSDRSLESIFFFSTPGSQDRLGLRRTCLSNLEDYNNVYQQCAVRFLQDPNRSGRFAVGADTYARAASHFIKLLEEIDWDGDRRLNLDVADETTLMDRLIVYKGVWILDHSVGKEADTIQRTIAISAFLFSGYVLFFLHRAGKHGLLIQQCQQKKCFTSTWLTSSFPKRTSLVLQEMKAYLERVGEGP